MKRSLLLFCAILIPAFTNFSQEMKPSPTPSRPRVVGVAPSPTPSKIVVITNNLPPAPSPTPKPVYSPSPSPTPIIVGSTPNPKPVYQTGGNQLLSLGQIKSKLEEAKREMTARPITIALTDGTFTTNMVRVAFYDWDTRRLDYLVLTKDSFLTKEGEFFLTSANSKSMKINIVRPNGVNTPVIISDLTGKTHLPLMVQYPVERGGKYYETAYYMSTHPGLVTPEVVNAGKLYIRNTIDIAREKLRQKGIYIAPNVTDMAERLSIVEHVDHLRFRTEYHPNIYNDIFTLYALNEGQTYRYSVSSAGAGGMVQMIPSTYLMVRSRYFNAGLMPDFVEGMRNHVNAAQAMLCYMQMTYNDLVANPTIAEAIRSGVARESELMSAGYNSNPAKLAGYIKRGGANWRSLIPRETQIYLQINASLDQYVPIVPRTK
ncbi:MAG: hypothetical protein JSS81_11770 [Acidobacteria bacterium]|nr:hypothetical protein [Acidobacteriota bacterium]